MHLYQALATLEQLGLVRRAAEEEPGFSFKHILIQETAYGSLLRQDRRSLHRVIGDIHQRLYAGDLQDYLLLLAFHYREAGDKEQALQFLLQYADRASRMSAYPEAIVAYERALELTEHSALASRARLLARVGDLRCRRSDFSGANENFETALQLAVEVQDASLVSTAWSSLARLARLQGEHARARDLGARALESAEAAQNKSAMAQAHRELGISHNLEGDNALARRHLSAALDLYRELGDGEGTSGALNSLGVVAREEHDLVLARACFEDAYRLSEVHGDKYSMGIRLTNLGVVAEQLGDLADAAQYQERAQALALEIGDREGAALTDMNLGSLALTQGNPDHALGHFRHALAETIAINSIPYALYALACLAKWEVSRRNFQRGAELLGLAIRHPSSTADISIDFEPVQQELKSLLGEPEFAAAFTRGAAMNLRETVRAILHETT